MAAHLSLGWVKGGGGHKSFVFHHLKIPIFVKNSQNKGFEIFSNYKSVVLLRPLADLKWDIYTLNTVCFLLLADQLLPNN